MKENLMQKLGKSLGLKLHSTSPQMRVNSTLRHQSSLLELGRRYMIRKVREDREIEIVVVLEKKLKKVGRPLTRKCQCCNGENPLSPRA